MDPVLAQPKPPPLPSPAGPLPSCPELLAPAGDWECAKAAVENGADAIYFGLDRFNARMRAHNFTEADLPGLLDFLHRRGVKAYVTLNTLVFENELADAEQLLRAVITAGVDAAIIQDVGLCRIIRQISPDFPIHGSTQMTITSAAGVEFARNLGCNLVVMARECSVKELALITGSAASTPQDSEKRTAAVWGVRAPAAAHLNDALAASSPNATQIQTAAAGPSPLHSRGPGEPSAPLVSPSGAASTSSLPLEVFIHGALCVAYSGQCLTSEALGGRSANRGECAQACRMPYELICDGQPVPLGDRRYLLSPQDLAGLEVLPDLMRAGISSLKIEGRLKTPEYVANITRVYRQALDRLIGPGDRLNDTLSFQQLQRDSRYDLEMAFSRGLAPGWMRGINNQELVHARFGKKRGVYLGEVERIERDRVVLHLEDALKPGDGVVFDAGHPDEQEQGGRVYSVEVRGPAQNRMAVLGFGRDDVDFNKLHVGDKLWKTSDPELDRRLRRTFESEAPQFQRPLHMEAHGHAGTPMTLIVRDDSGHVVQLDSAMPLAAAEKHPLTMERLQEQLGRLGGSIFKLGTLVRHLEGEVMLPMSELNRMRREAVARIEALRARPLRWRINAPGPRVCAGVGAPPAALANAPSREQILRVSQAPAAAAGPPPQHSRDPRLSVLIRTFSQLEAALRSGAPLVYCEFEDLKKYREAVAIVRQLPSASCPEIFVAPPRIFKAGEEWTLKQVRSSEADGYLIRNYDHLKFFANDRKIGDFSLNVANRIAAAWFLLEFKLERLTASYDLNIVQLEALLKAAPPAWFEVTIHQHIPMFHMEHCVFCAFLTKGTDYTNCGRPCDTHEVRLRDRVGLEHPLKADAGCRNTVFNGRAQTGAEYAAQLAALGLRHFRIEFVNETGEETARAIERYQKLLRGEITGAALWRELKLQNQLGVTRGPMEKR